MNEVPQPAKIILSECYVCSQGEGRLFGKSSILVRTSSCNLRCKWKNNFCDTYFTSWAPEMGWQVTPAELLQEIEKLRFLYPHIKRVIISGGEPTLFADSLVEVVRQLVLRELHVTVETNGTNWIDVCNNTFPFNEHWDKILFSISPKLKSSVPIGTPYEKMHEEKRINLVVLRRLLEVYDSYLKFVISSDRDIEEVNSLVEQLSLDPDRVYLMPEGVSDKELQEKRQFINYCCLKYGYSQTDRLHILTFGNQRRT